VISVRHAHEAMCYVGDLDFSCSTYKVNSVNHVGVGYENARGVRRRDSEAIEL
jgi:hypothetical protein